MNLFNFFFDAESMQTEGDLLEMQRVSAVLGLARAAAIAIRDKKVNGEMESALKVANEASIKHQDFITRIATWNTRR